MLDNPPYKRFMLVCLLVLMMSFFVNELTPKGPPENLAHDGIAVEGYVASKRLGSIWLTDQPVTVWDRLTFKLFTDYTTVVHRHEDAAKFTLFNGLKLNQQVRVYGDILLESYPGRIKAYHIEKID